MSISADVTVPPRSRTFTEDDARDVLKLMRGEADGQEAPAKNVGFGEFDSQGAARSAGNSLNRLLESIGAEHRYAVTTFEREGKVVGVLLNKPAKKRAEGGARNTRRAQTQRGGRSR